jgi:general stress protein 26
MNSSDYETQGFKHLWEIIHHVRFALLTNRNPQGQFTARPLTTQNPKEDQGRTIYFFVSQHSEWVKELMEEEKFDARAGTPVGLVYADPGEDQYVSISGEAHFEQNLTLQKALWSPIAQAWFPGGFEDPDLRLLQVKIDTAEYWDITTNKMMQILKMTQAAITGHPPTDMGEHRLLKG